MKAEFWYMITHESINVHEFTKPFQTMDQQTSVVAGEQAKTNICIEMQRFNHQKSSSTNAATKLRP